MKERSARIKKLAVMAMLVALSIVLVWLIHFPIFAVVPFLEYDPADIPILIGTFAYGPLAGIALTVVASLIQGFTVSAQSGVMGIAMHIFATSTLVLAAGCLPGAAAGAAGYVTLPTMLALAACGFLLWTLARWTKGGMTLRAYVHAQTVKRLPAEALLAAGMSAFGAVGQGIALLLENLPATRTQQNRQAK